MPKGKILGATCRRLGDATIDGTTKQVLTTERVYISAINVSLPVTIDGTEGSTTIIVYDSNDDAIFRLVTGASGEGSISFPAPLPADGVKLASVATVAGKVTVYVV